jgi:HEPN domain-containing protein
MNRAELQQLAEERLDDAQVLLAGNRWTAAYYLAGYAVECGLKSCVLAYVLESGIIFQDKKFAGECWTHNVENLVKLARLQEKQGLAISANRALRNNWMVVKDWTETSRYETKSESEAQKLFDAINDPQDGVMQWVKTHW